MLKITLDLIFFSTNIILFIYVYPLLFKEIWKEYSLFFFKIKLCCIATLTQLNKPVKKLNCAFYRSQDGLGKKSAMYSIFEILRDEMFIFETVKIHK